jgi:aminopeptidase N
VLKQLVAWVGIDAFYAGVSAYFTKHEWGNTELVDLLTELETASGRDLSDWGKLWLETAGVNTLRPEISVDENGVITAFTVLQSAVAAYPTIRPHRLAIGFYNTVDGKLLREHRLELDVDGERTDVPELVGRKRPDLVLLNDDDLAYAKIRLDDASLAVATESLATIEDPLARSLVWAAAWDATRDAETPAREYVRLVLGNIASESESTTIRTTLTQLVLAATQYVAPEVREDVLVEVGDTLWQLAEAAEPGSDAQFQFVKFFAGVASTDVHFDILRGLRAGELTLDGLTVDTDLDWELLTALTAGGVAGNDEVDAALADDNTANGAKAAALARAAIPALEAKRTAWASVVDTDTAPNAIVQWTGIGFQRARDKEVLATFIPDYFGMLQRIWESRSYKIAEYLVMGLYPAPLANEELRQATVAWLDTNPEPPALRRIVVENLAGVERALKAQERDARA